MNLVQGSQEVTKLRILSTRRLGDILKISRETLLRVADHPELNYDPFDSRPKARPFQKKPLSTKARPIDNPLRELCWIQKRIYRRLLKPICFPKHILGAVRNRSVRDNAEYHLQSDLLVTLDIKQCFPSISNAHVYRVWSDLLGCSPPVAALLTRLTTYRRRLPQGAATSPLLANLFIWMVDEPIRQACVDRGVAYSTWIDDLAFSGQRARDLIQLSCSVLQEHGLRVSRKKIRIMGPHSVKLLTGTRLGASVRVPKEKLSRVRSGIHKLKDNQVREQEEQGYILGLVGQIRFLRQICPKDARTYASELMELTKGRSTSRADLRFLAECSGDILVG